MKKTKTDFIIGDKWIFYKIFCGPNDAEYILCESIQPVINQLFEQKIIRKWFYIRYNVPSNHLRIRFELTSQDKIGELISIIYKTLSPFYKTDLIGDIEISTYKREIQRYVNGTIKIAEKIFYYDSEIILHFLSSQYQIDQNKKNRWLYGLKIIDYYLECFKISIDQKVVLMETWKDNFAYEFGMNTIMKKQLEKKYRIFQSDIDKYLNASILFHDNSNSNREKLANNIHELRAKTKNLSYTELTTMIQSYIHMSLNRLFSSNNRKYELVCYYFLFRSYRSQIAMQKHHKQK
ncbi:thiopeptide-type bacteriocin biosynthesis protein [Christiangramia sp. LLG6405-1]|uniref:thiopeptide-type bacteriocin biosynthesis protein n=1 Tax=Christiangramia sp. LLG6405-1 TaxID=3160832 RepID=UPI00386B14E7